MTTHDKNIISALYEETFGKKPEEILPIAGGGGGRRYYRITDREESVVGVVSEDKNETEAFFKLDNYLESSGIKVPKILNATSDHKSYLLDDLGSQPLMGLLGSEEGMKLSQNALDCLIEIQTLPEKDWEKLTGFPPFSERLVRWDLNYFKYDFLKPALVEFDEEKLEDDFDKITESLTTDEMVDGFMYRDFQSRNIMVKDHKLWFIDFQGARKGPLTYDAVSFIWQAKAPFSVEERIELMDYYASCLSAKKKIEKSLIQGQLNIMMIFRTLQVLGAYGFRGLIEKKPHFLESIPLAIGNLSYMMERGFLNKYPELKRISKRLVEWNQRRESPEDKELVIRVFSFSYKKGYPEDLTGTGGGFMFDCRAIHNPGRYEEYKTKTGMDIQVIDFLRKTEEADLFLNNSYAIVKPSIERYLKRGFTSLQVGFGCTGGQHRSVYCAEGFVKMIENDFPDVKIILSHREQGVTKVFGEK